MALTRPRLGQLDTSVFAAADPITVLHAGTATANVDVGLLMNRANGLVSNVALYWNESGNAFITAFTSNTGTTDSNIAVTSYANIITGTHTVYGPILPGANVVYDLGSPTQRFRTLYISGNTIDMGGALISSGTSGVTITHNSGAQFSLAAAGTTPTTSNASGAFGNVNISSGIASTSTTTGALQVAGGAGVTGNIFAGGNLTSNGSLTLAGNATVGNVINFTGGVGSGLSASYSTGTSLLQIDSTGAWTTSSNVRISSTTPSTSTSSGALTVAGGMGIGGNLYVAGNLDVAGTTIFRNIETVTTTEYVSTLNATNVYASTIGNVGAAVIGATGRFDTSVITATLNAATIGNTNASLIGATGRFDTSVITAILNAATIGNTGAALTGTLQTAAQPNITSVGTLTGLKVNSSGIQSDGTIITGTINAATIGNTGATLTGTVSTASQTNITSVGTLTSLSVSGALTAGSFTVPTASQPNITSVGTLSTLTVSGVSVHNGNMVAASGTTSTSGTTGAVVVQGGIGVSGNIYVDRVYTTNGLYWSGNGYIMSTGGGGGTAAGATGQVQYNSSGTFAASSLYYYSGNSSIAAVGGTASTSTTSGQLQVVGGVGITGDMYVAGNISAASLNSTVTNTLSVNSPLVYLSASPSYPYNYDIGLYSHFVGGPANVYAHSGFVRSNSSGYWGAFSNVKSEPSGTVNWSDAGIIWDTIKAGGLILANTTTSTSTSTGALVVSGGAGVAGALYAASVYDNGNRVLTSLSSSGAGNLTVSVSAPAGTTVSLPATGPGAITVGSSTSIPVITTDAYGRISALTSSAVSTTINLSGTSGTGSVAGGGTLTFAGSNGITATVSSSIITVGISTSATPTLAGATVNGTIVASAINAGTIGNTSATLTGTLQTASQTNITAVGTLTGLTVNGTTTRSSKSLITNYTGSSAPTSPQQGDEWYKSGSDILYKYVYDGTGYSWVDLTSPLYNANVSAISNTLALRDSSGSLTATTFIGKATSAQYADLAENYVSDSQYAPGTVVVFGGEKEITITNVSHDSRVAGVISTNPAYLMNSECEGLPIAFTGRVPCRVMGPIEKGQLLVTSTIAGVAQALINTQFVPGCVIGKSLENITTNEIATIEVVVGRF